MIKIEVTDEWEVNIRTNGMPKELLEQTAVLIAALHRSAPRVFKKELLHACVDTAMELKPDDGELKDEE